MANPDQAIVTNDETAEIIEICEREDEEMVLAELKGMPIHKLVYQFTDGGKPQNQLTFAGVNWACREYAKHGEAIRMVSKPEIQADPLDPEYVLISIVAQRFAVKEGGKEVALDSHVGAKRQWRNREIKQWQN